MSPFEKQRLRFLNLAYFRQIENVQFQGALGVIGDPSDRLQAVRARLQSDPQFREDYEWGRAQFSTEFRKMMDEFLE